MDSPFTINAKIDARVRDNRFIEIATGISDSLNERAAQLHSRIMDTEDRFIAEGLIRLGWTPPASDDHSQDAVPYLGNPAIRAETMRQREALDRIYETAPPEGKDGGKTAPSAVPSDPSPRVCVRDELQQMLWLKLFDPREADAIVDRILDRLLAEVQDEGAKDIRHFLQAVRGGEL